MTNKTISDILKGIDKDEISSENGWWETKSGVSFGSQILQEAVRYEQELLAKIAALEENLK